MSKDFTGTVRKNDLEGGFFELHTDGGEVYRLSGAASGRAKAGQRVRVRGRIQRGGFGIHMSGPALEAESLEAL